jgi:release factor glutamine methyltransferase
MPEVKKAESPATVAQALEEACALLARSGVLEPRSEAGHLLAWVTGLRRETFVADPARTLDAPSLQKFRVVIRRRAAGMPAAYITCEQEFFGRSFHVDKRVLVPRPETELLVEEAANRLPRDAALNLLDACTGSGCVAVTLARERPAWRLFASDISAGALAVAARNAARHQAAVRLVRCDLLEAFPPRPRFDAVVSNPPYLGDADWPLADESVRRFEPRAALYAGPKGTEIMERLAYQAMARLVSSGLLLMEVSPFVAEAARRSAEAEGFSVEALRKDYAGHERLLVARRP